MVLKTLTFIFLVCGEIFSHKGHLGGDSFVQLMTDAHLGC